MEHAFPYASPESAGISSYTVMDSLRRLDDALVPMHSLLIMRHGRLVTEAYWKPWDSERLHRMYSCTKSFVSIAIGHLASEGMLSLDDPITEYFPEYMDEMCRNGRLDRTTVRHMLMMASCHSRTAYKEGSSSWNYVESYSGHEWVKPFFTVPPDHEPGSIFIYDTSATQVLAALAEKLSGMDLLSYLRKTFLTDPRFFSDAYIIKEPGGHSAGGSGLMCRPSDMLYAIDALMHYEDDGAFGSYISEAVSKRIDTALGARAGLIDTASGYGYQIWMNSHGYMFYGMGSQLALAIPDKDMAVVVTADTQGVPDAEGRIFDTVWRIVDSASANPLPDDPEAFSALSDAVDRLSMRTAPGSAESSVSSAISGKVFTFGSNRIGIERLKCTLGDGSGILEFYAGGERFSLDFGIGSNKESYAELPFRVPSLSSAGWQSSTVLGIHTEYIGEECGSLVVQIAFADGKATVFMRESGELSVRPLNGVASSL